MRVRQLAPGLWTWSAPHPSWRDGADWPQEVNCVYFEAADAVVLIDPLVDEEERFFTALDRDVERLGLPVAVLLTTPWHRRSAGLVAARYGAAIWEPAAPPELPAGIETFAPDGVDEAQVAFVLRPHAALVVAEYFKGVDGGLRVCLPPKLRDRAAFAASLLGLLELPIERVLVSHGEPVLADARARLAEALAAFA